MAKPRAYSGEHPEHHEPKDKRCSRKRERRTRLIGILVMASLLLAPNSALAASGTGPGDAAGPSDGWEQLPVGQTSWYEFTYLGHYESEDGKDGEERAIFVGTPVEVWPDVEPDDGAVFQIFTAEAIRAWVAGEDLQSCGCGTENEALASDLS